MRELLIATNPEVDSRLAYLMRVPLGDGIVLRTSGTWPRTKALYCYPVPADEWPAAPDIVERVPLRSCARRAVQRLLKYHSTQDHTLYHVTPAYHTFQAVNNSDSPCQAGGYFGVSIYDQAGTLLNTTDTRVTDLPEGGPVRPITLTAGQALHFQVQIGENPTGATTCPVIGAFHLIPPNATADDQVSVPASAKYWFYGNNILVGPDIFGTPSNI